MSTKTYCFVILSLATLFSSCDFETPQKEVDLANIILDARSFYYTELPAHVKSEAQDAYTFAYSGETSEKIPKETGWYVRLIFDNYNLANACTSDTNLSRLLRPDNLRALYGKYVNTPVFYTQKNSEIKKTRKHEGYNLFYISRNNKIDTTFYGPVSDEPASLVFNCAGLDSARQPEKVINHYQPYPLR